VWGDGSEKVFEEKDRGVYKMAVAQDRDRWRAVVHTVMNLQFRQNAGNFVTR
jgi:hypothetical protein